VVSKGGKVSRMTKLLFLIPAAFSVIMGCIPANPQTNRAQLADEFKKGWKARDSARVKRDGRHYLSAVADLDSTIAVLIKLSDAGGIERFRFSGR
jgi:hypothetical protein